MSRQQGGVKIYGPYPTRGKFRVIVDKSQRTFDTLEEAQEFVSRQKDALKVHRLIQEYLDVRHSEGLADNSLVTLRHRLRQYFPDESLLTTEITHGYVTQRRYVIGHMKTYTAIIAETRKFLTWCVGSGRCTVNPLDRDAD